MLRSTAELHWRRRTRHARRWSYNEAIGREMRRTRIILTNRRRLLTAPGNDRPALIVPRLDRRRIYVDASLVERQRQCRDGLETVFSLAWHRWVDAFIPAEAKRRGDGEMLALWTRVIG